MYLDHFGLSRQPFQITPDADFFYPGAERESTLQGLIHSALNNEGIVKVIGEIGSGKSLLCRMLAAGLPDHFRVVFLANPNLEANEVVEAILGDLGVQPQPGSFGHPTQLLQSYLLEQNRLGNRVLLLVEEAQAMPAATLEALRLLTNLETAETKLLRMILFGQPELDQTLNEYTLRQFRDRVTQNFYLRAMVLEEAGEYLHHRLCVAGYQGEPLFKGELLRQLHEITGGRLRPLNVFADKTLLAAYVDDTKVLTEQHLTRASLEMATPPSNNGQHDDINHAKAVGPADNPTPAPPPQSAEVTWRLLSLLIWQTAQKLARKLLLVLLSVARSSFKKLKMWRKHSLIQGLTVGTRKKWKSAIHFIRRN